MVQLVSLTEDCPETPDIVCPSLVFASKCEDTEETFVAWRYGPVSRPDSLWANGERDKDCPVPILGQGYSSGVGFFRKNRLVRMIGMIERFTGDSIEKCEQDSRFDLFAMYWAYEVNFFQTVGTRVNVQHIALTPDPHFYYKDKLYHLYLEVEGDLSEAIRQFGEYGQWIDLDNLAKDKRALFVVNSDDPRVTELFEAHPKMENCDRIQYGYVPRLFEGVPGLKSLSTVRTKYRGRWQERYVQSLVTPRFPYTGRGLPGRDEELNRMISQDKPFVLFTTDAPGLEQLAIRLIEQDVTVIHTGAPLSILSDKYWNSKLGRPFDALGLHQYARGVVTRAKGIPSAMTFGKPCIVLSDEKIYCHRCKENPEKYQVVREITPESIEAFSRSIQH